GYVVRALESGKHVFVEKPLCLDPNELDTIRQKYAESKNRLMVGFNRRFAPFSKTLKEKLAVGGPVAMLYRINAGMLPGDHWVHDPRIGGGRILGEVCHFIDYCMFLSGTPITQVSAVGLDAPGGKQDTVAIQLRFANGSIASIDYFSNGNPHLPKERIEVFSRGSVAVIEDFRTLSLFGKATQKESMNQDKGHAAGVRAFLESIRKGAPSPIPFDEIDLVTRATFAVLESIAMKGTAIRL
ncbi:MAG: Gfo/Idh/MocA family protein, partial [Bacteroidota bacterium]